MVYVSFVVTWENSTVSVVELLLSVHWCVLTLDLKGGLKSLRVELGAKKQINTFYFNFHCQCINPV